jgi:hypothetical protein
LEETSESTKQVHQLGGSGAGTCCRESRRAGTKYPFQITTCIKGNRINPSEERDLINIGREALKFLFGIATTQQLQELHDTVEGIKNKGGDVIHAVQQQLTYLKSVDEEVSQNTVGLARVARILKSVITNALNRHKT